MIREIGTVLSGDNETSGDDGKSLPLGNWQMSNFACEKCGTICYDTPSGYITGCEHYPADIKKREDALKELTQQSQELGLYDMTDNPMIDEGVDK